MKAFAGFCPAAGGTEAVGVLALGGTLMLGGGTLMLGGGTLMLGGGTLMFGGGTLMLGVLVFAGVALGGTLAFGVVVAGMVVFTLVVSGSPVVPLVFGPVFVALCGVPVAFGVEGLTSVCCVTLFVGLVPGLANGFGDSVALTVAFPVAVAGVTVAFDGVTPVPVVALVPSVPFMATAGTPVPPPPPPAAGSAAA